MTALLAIDFVEIMNRQSNWDVWHHPTFENLLWNLIVIHKLGHVESI
jgi:hypothetical protein